MYIFFGTHFRSFFFNKCWLTLKRQTSEVMGVILFLKVSQGMLPEATAVCSAFSENVL